jgi:hypothetical protein
MHDMILISSQVWIALETQTPIKKINIKLYSNFQTA